MFHRQCVLLAFTWGDFVMRIGEDGLFATAAVIRENRQTTYGQHNDENTHNTYVTVGLSWKSLGVFGPLISPDEEPGESSRKGFPGE